MPNKISQSNPEYPTLVARAFQRHSELHVALSEIEELDRPLQAAEIEMQEEWQAEMDEIKEQFGPELLSP